ncbi:hypothetical protein JCM6882_006146 [Rhodosporidiobolus microsporus]
MNPDRPHGLPRHPPSFGERPGPSPLRTATYPGEGEVNNVPRPALRTQLIPLHRHLYDGSSANWITYDEVSYINKIWPTLTRINVEWEKYVVGCPPGQQGGLFELEARWEESVRGVVKAYWRVWAEDGARKEARNILEGVLQKIKLRTLHQFPPVSTFEHLPQNPDHQPQLPHPHHLHLPPAGQDHNMRELARGHRRMTESQARRYATTESSLPSVDEVPLTAVASSSDLFLFSFLPLALYPLRDADMPLPPHEHERLSTFFSKIRQAFGRSLHSNPAARAAGHTARLAFQAVENRWERDIENAFEQNRARWNLLQTDHAFNAFEHLLARVADGEITDIGQLIQGWQLNKFPTEPLQLFNSEYPLEATVSPGPVPIPAHAPGQPFLPHHLGGGAPLSADDLSYHLDIWPLLTQIRAAFEGFIGDIYPREEHADQLAIQTQWDTAVRAFVQEHWVFWGLLDGGLARTQAREMLEQVNDTFKVFPPIELFAMLPAEFGRFVNPEPTPHLLPPQPNARPSSAHSHRGVEPSPWTTGEVYSLEGYRQTLLNYLQQNQHLARPRSRSSAGGQRNMRELARGHRRMTESQARRYGTTVQAFAAGL